MTQKLAEQQAMKSGSTENNHLEILILPSDSRCRTKCKGTGVAKRSTIHSYQQPKKLTR